MWNLRFLATLGILACFGCQPQTVATSVSAPGGVDHSWLHLTSENWDYTTLTPWPVEEYRFNGGGMVICQFAPKQYSDASRDASLFYYVDSNGDLAITEKVNGKARWVFRLVSLSATTAEVAELTTGKPLRFDRRYFARRY